MPKARIRLLTAIILIALFLAGAWAQAGLRVSFLDLGQAEGTLLQGPDFTILIDTGDQGRDDLLPKLRDLGVEKIDLLVLTHPHADHLGQACQVLDTFPVKEVWMCGSVHTTALFEKVLDTLEASSAGYYQPRRGEVIHFGDLSLEILNPEEPLKTSLHENCLVLRAVYGRVAFLFTADIEQKTEKEILAAGLPLRAQILQVAHHGSGTSSNVEFLIAVDPDLAVYSAGKGNIFGHPHQEVVERFLGLGIPLYGTDSLGTITVFTDGNSYWGDFSLTEQPLVLNRVDLNSAGWEELQKIVHIGPARAEEIIKMRAASPFRSLDDLKRIPGLGPVRIEEIKKQGIAYVGG
ncbi:MAG: MBL fold metallo-hydrolase [Firmicutes bacterium]|nr:MBL fold metallo-hydrolase [Bacillota bacterium]